MRKVTDFNPNSKKVGCFESKSVASVRQNLHPSTNSGAREAAKLAVTKRQNVQVTFEILTRVTIVVLETASNFDVFRSPSMQQNLLLILQNLLLLANNSKICRFRRQILFHCHSPTIVKRVAAYEKMLSNMSNGFVPFFKKV